MQSTVLAPGACFATSSLAFMTERARQFIDITDSVAHCVQRSGVRDGLVVVASRHTTAAIVVNESEPELLKDLDTILARLAPDNHQYAHNGVPCGKGERPNGHAHCQALFLNASTSLPLLNGEVLLGRYQRIFLVELDGARTREVTVLSLGV